MDRSEINRDYRYEARATKLPLVADVKQPKEGDEARTATGVIFVWRGGEWCYA